MTPMCSYTEAKGITLSTKQRPESVGLLYSVKKKKERKKNVLKNNFFKLHRQTRAKI